MKKFMLSLVAIAAFAQGAHAYEVQMNSDEEIQMEEEQMMTDDVAAYGRGGGRGNGPGWGNPGRGPGWGRPGHGPGRPGPGRPGPGYPPPGHGGPRPGPRPPHPGPGYPPPPPHQPTVEYVTCESYGNRYNTCYVNPYGIRRVFLARQNSNARCDANRSFGLSGNYIWVDHGCRGVFGVERY